MRCWTQEALHLVKCFKMLERSVNLSIYVSSIFQQLQEIAGRYERWSQKSIRSTYMNGIDIKG